MSGPKVQVPTMLNPIQDLVLGKDGKIQSLRIDTDWASFFSSLQLLAFNDTRNGPTTQRPTNAQPGRFIGMRYFDTTLGYPVYLKSVGPDVWARWDGTAV